MKKQFLCLVIALLAACGPTNENVSTSPEANQKSAPESNLVKSFGSEVNPRYQAIIDRLHCGPTLLPNSKIQEILSDVILDRGAEATELNAVLAVGACVQSVLPSLDLPKGLKLVVNKNYFEAVTILGAMEVSLPFNLDKLEGMELTQKAKVDGRSDLLSMAVLAHEWTHPFFNEALWPGFNKLKSNLRNPSWGGHNLPVTRPYHELVADIIAVTIAGNPIVMNLHKSGRNFLIDAPKGYLERFRLLFTAKEEPGVYEFFDPVRKYLWSRVISTLRTPQQRVDALAKIVSIIKVDALECEQNHGISLSDANERLIQKFDQAFFDASKIKGLR